MQIKQALRKLKLTTIGRIDRVDFPELGLFDVPAKIDSGAYTCVMHCESIRPFYKEQQHLVAFCLPNSPQEKIVPVYTSKQVRNSFGQVEYRYAIKTPIVLFEKTYQVELTLANRSAMKFPVLLGRKLLRNRFIIDVTRINLSYRKKQKKLKPS